MALEEVLGLSAGVQKRFNTLSQRKVTPTRLLKIGGLFLRLAQLARSLEDRLFPRRGVVHSVSLLLLISNYEFPG
jgi:hypothetical protein